MLSDLDKQINGQDKRIQAQIDDYRDTIFSILGFCSLWFFDAATNQNRTYVKVFQGRHLSPVDKDSQITHEQHKKDVCPDLGIVIRDQVGILGEVKKNFPKGHDERGKEIFAQLKAYDQELIGWPTNNERLQSHELVLLVHQTTSRAAQDFYTKDVKEGDLRFDRPFSIVQFNRSDQRVPYFFFQLVEGKIDKIEGSVDLYHGIQVPMKNLLALYSVIKLYDAKPPLAYLLNLIWDHVLTPLASEDPKFERLRINQKLEITVVVEDIIKRLHEGFSFFRWHTQYPNRQPQVPHKEWVQEACQFLVEVKEARWAKDNTELIVFYRKYADVLAHFVHLLAESETKDVLQPKIPGFETPKNKNAN